MKISVEKLPNLRGNGGNLHLHIFYSDHCQTSLTCLVECADHSACSELCSRGQLHRHEEVRADPEDLHRRAARQGGDQDGEPGEEHFLFSLIMDS